MIISIKKKKKAYWRMAEGEKTRGLGEVEQLTFTNVPGYICEQP